MGPNETTRSKIRVLQSRWQQKIEQAHCKIRAISRRRTHILKQVCVGAVRRIGLRGVGTVGYAL